VKPDAAIILGTGLGGMVDRVNVTHRIAFHEVFSFPVSALDGHKGDTVFGTLGGARVLVFQGRLHYYEGYSLQQVTLPVRIARALGAEVVMINSAAGGLNPLFRAGDVMIVTDHINLLGANPLRGVTDGGLGDRFPDMSHPYDVILGNMASQAALDLRIPVKQGVYAALSGPSLETRAETRMLRLLGADAVGMSTVPEVIVARQVGLRTLALAAITNVNLPDCMEPISVEQVIANAGLASPQVAAILEETLRRATTAQTGFQEPLTGS
jgi:purine-nucleoside phosphorylase